MREIKYKARLIKDVPISSEGVIRSGDWVTFHALSWVPSWTECVDVQTIREYTGFKDAAGKEIYEGEVVHVGTEYNNLSRKDGRPVYDEVRMIHGRWEPLCFCKDGSFSVEGNIYENPELLEQRNAA